MDFYSVLVEIYPMLLDGLAMTLQTSLIAIFIAFFLGLLSCVMGISKIVPLSLISKFYVWVIRGTPFIVQLFIIKYGIPQLIKLWMPEFNISIFQAAVITLALNAGAYMSEIFRGSIAAIDPGQMEAARSLGLTYWRSMFRVVLPQAIKNMIPSIVNQLIITLKDTSILSVIGFPELVNKAQNVIAITFKSFQVWAIVAVMYLVVILSLQQVAKALERRLNRGRE